MFAKISKSVFRLTPLTTRYFATAASPSTASKLTSFPQIINVLPEEGSLGVLGWKNLELANRALHTDGLVVLENAISTQKLDRLNEKMVADALKLQAEGDEGPYNYNKGYFRQSLQRHLFNET